MRTLTLCRNPTHVACLVSPAVEPVDVWIKAMADQQVQDITPVYYHVLLALRDPDEDELDAVR